MMKIIIVNDIFYDLCMIKEMKFRLFRQEKTTTIRLIINLGDTQTINQLLVVDNKYDIKTYMYFLSFMNLLIKKFAEADCNLFDFNRHFKEVIECIGIMENNLTNNFQKKENQIEL